jgi:gamma-glutamylcyclotransferase (GGCT)/AIG2-like uncharacterized protein YtfP
VTGEKDLKEPTRQRLFTYGSLLDRTTMLDRAPAARRLSPAVLEDWRLTFRRGVADVAPAAGRGVLGGLWSVEETDFDSLDGYEGIVSGSYFRYMLPVSTDQGEVWAWTYVMPSGPGDREPLYEGYLATVVDGLGQWGHPTTELERAVAESSATP